MRKNVRKSIFFIIMISFTLVLSACSSTEKENKAENEKNIRVGLVSSSSGFGDGAFNDLTLKGVEKAKEDFGIEYDKVQIKAVGDIELSLRDMASTGDYDLIMALTYESIQAINKVAPDYPDQKFAVIDTGVEQPNVVSYMTRDEEGSYLVGVAAAKMKEKFSDFNLKNSEKIGFIGGVDAPNIRVFYAGYTAGAKSINKNIESVADFVGSFTDVTTTKEIANSMNQHEIDTIFHAAGMSGNGLFQSAKENKTIAFGVNLNQNETEPDVIAASMIKNVDVEAYEAIKSVVEDSFKAEVIKLGLKENGVDFVTEGSNIVLPKDVMDSVEEAKEKIINGEIKVPSDMDALDEFEKNLK